MFARILVPVDFTPKNEPALDTAARLVRLGGGHITLLHVIETLALPFEELREFYEELELKARTRLDAMASSLRDRDVENVDRVVLYGRRAEEVVGYADDEGSDVIILSSHRVDPENPGMSWATLSYKVAILAQCPVLLVK